MDAQVAPVSAGAATGAAPAKRGFGLETVGMTKVFGSLTALDDVSIRI